MVKLHEVSLIKAREERSCLNHFLTAPLLRWQLSFHVHLRGGRRHSHSSASGEPVTGQWLGKENSLACVFGGGFLLCCYSPFLGDSAT